MISSGVSKLGWVDNCQRWMKTNDGVAFIALASTFNPPQPSILKAGGRGLGDYVDFVAQFLGESKLNNLQTVKGNLRNKAFCNLPPRPRNYKIAKPHRVHILYISFCFYMLSLRLRFFFVSFGLICSFLSIWFHFFHLCVCQYSASMV